MPRDPIKRAQRDFQRQVGREIDKVRSGCFFTIWAIVITLALLAVGGFFLWKAWKDGYFDNLGKGGGDDSAEETSWDGKTPLVCGGNDKMTVSNVAATLPDNVVVEAKGNCELVLESVSLSGRVAVSAGGNAEVTIKSGSLTGSQLAIEAGGLSTVTLESGVEVSGEVKQAGQAEIVGDTGGGDSAPPAEKDGESSDDDTSDDDASPEVE